MENHRDNPIRRILQNILVEDKIGTKKEVINNAFLFGSTCNSWNKGLVKLIFKKGDANELKNYRPITLLSTDYKILSKIINKRLTDVLPSIIMSTQKCNVKDRNIFDAALKIKSSVDYAKDKGLPLIVMSLDQEKAFDMVNHGFMMAW